MLLHLSEIRNKCKRECAQFKYPLYLFNRIPMYIFAYFAIDNPLDDAPEKLQQYNIIVTFMLINNITADFMLALYNCGNQPINVLLKLHEIFIKCWQIYRLFINDDLFELFGDNFAIHLETRTLRRIDMSIANYSSRQKEYFVPNKPYWRKLRSIRQQIKNNTFRINDVYDLDDYREAKSNGLFKRGAHK